MATENGGLSGQGNFCLPPDLALLTDGAPTMTKPFDLVVHGATGFTGRLVVEYLLQRYPAGSGLRWAMGAAMPTNSPPCATKWAPRPTPRWS